MFLTKQYYSWLLEKYLAYYKNILDAVNNVMTIAHNVLNPAYKNNFLTIVNSFMTIIINDVFTIVNNVLTRKLLGNCKQDYHHSQQYFLSQWAMAIVWPLQAIFWLLFDHCKQYSGYCLDTKIIVLIIINIVSTAM